MGTLGGLGSTNSFANNGYASNGSAFASDAFQAEHPCYVLNITVPYEACVNYEAELAYIYQFGEILSLIHICSPTNIFKSFTPPQKGAGMMLEGADKATCDKLAGILATKHII